MKIKTKINKIGRNSKKQKGFINPPIYKGSTIVFENFNQYKNEKNIYEALYGLNRTQISKFFGLAACNIKEKKENIKIENTTPFQYQMY